MSWSARSSLRPAEEASANSQQAAGISQLNDSVAHFNRITQQNAAGRAGKMAVPPARSSAVTAEMNEEPCYQARYGT
jgi:methyl-accepting chemotaxis protein